MTNRPLADRWWPWLVALLLLAFLIGETSGAPESADLRSYLREPALSFAPGAWLDCKGAPNHVVGRGLEAALLSTGLDFEHLAFACLLCAALCVAMVLRLLPSSGLAGLLVPLLVLSPSHGSNWLLVERLRVFVPAACACGIVLLLRRAGGRARFGLALGLAVAAVFTHENGSLLWAAMLPLVAAAPAAGPRPAPPVAATPTQTPRSVPAATATPPEALRAILDGVATSSRATRAIVRLATWIVAGNIALAACYDESAREYPGLVAATLESPLDTLGFLARVLASPIPDVLAETKADSVLLGSLLFLALAGAAVACARCREPQRRASSRPWLCLGLAGFAQALAVAHVQVPQGVTDIVLREVAWGSWLVLAGIAGVVRSLAPARARVLGPLACGAALLLTAQDWYRGLGSLRNEARFLRQSEALLVFADLGPSVLPPSPQPAVPAAEDRAALHRLGLLRRAAPLRAPSSPAAAEGLEATAALAAGQLVQASQALAEGLVEVGSQAADLILVMRQREGEEARLCRIAAPDPFGSGTTAHWQADLVEQEPFVEREALFALAFDLRERAARPLHGRFLWRSGRFAANEDGR
jgi:hypothetical protein